MWTTYNSGEWRLDIYGDNMYASLLTNTSTGKIYITSDSEDISVSKYVPYNGFIVEDPDINTYAPVSKIIILIITDLYVREITSYEDEIGTLLRYREEEKNNMMTKEGLELRLQEITSIIEDFISGPTTEIQHDGWTIKYYGEIMFTMEKNQSKYINTERVDVDWKNAKIVIDGIRVYINDSITLLHIYSDEMRYLSDIYYHTSYDEVDDGRYDKKIEKLESILNSLSPAVLE